MKWLELFQFRDLEKGECPAIARPKEIQMCGEFPTLETVSSSCMPAEQSEVEPFSRNAWQKGLPTIRELALQWYALQRLANREQENRTLLLCVRRKEVNYIIVEEGKPGRTQALGICSQVDPAPNGARLELDGALAAVSVLLQNAF